MRFRTGLSLAIVVIGLITTVGSSVATAAPKYVFPVTCCAVSFYIFHSDIEATDILAKAGCKFVAPINGVIDEVNRFDSWTKQSDLGNARGGSSHLHFAISWPTPGDNWWGVKVKEHH